METQLQSSDNEKKIPSSRELLQALYKGKGIDVQNDRGWPLRVAKEMFDKGYFSHEDYAEHVNSDTLAIDSKIHNIDAVKTILLRHATTNTQIKDPVYIRAYCKYFGCSSDYLFGLIDKPTHIENDGVPLTPETIRALKKLRQTHENTKDFIDAANKSVGPYVDRTPYDTLELLNFLIQSPHFERILRKLEDYIKPEYDIPMFFLTANESPDGKAGYFIPRNQIHQTMKFHENGTPVMDENFMPEYERYLPLSNSPIITPGVLPDYRSISINESFLESVAMLDIQKAINDIKQDYIKAHTVVPAADKKKRQPKKKEKTK